MLMESMSLFVSPWFWGDDPPPLREPKAGVPKTPALFHSCVVPPFPGFSR
ncbi:hypothetical protein SAMN05216188_101114 [Lentzea xinjiangensis]|uniref:Uncharacterized protein n=1 Tax=Lentzea xinjiangensis TaxID=402600 RepID=A0A1H8ZQ84_9PSEU|nr:hypothetical protein SAMN05216188_101114 [Lentzea xinjiangensis]